MDILDDIVQNKSYIRVADTLLNREARLNTRIHLRYLMFACIAYHLDQNRTAIDHARLARAESFLDQKQIGLRHEGEAPAASPS